MALSSIKFAEKLIILKEVGQGVLERVHAVKRQFTSGTKPSFFVDPQLKKLLEVIAKKFPDFEPSVEKVEANVQRKEKRSQAEMWNSFEDDQRFMNFFGYFKLCGRNKSTMEFLNGVILFRFHFVEEIIMEFIEIIIATSESTWDLQYGVDTWI